MQYNNALSHLNAQPCLHHVSVILLQLMGSHKQIDNYTGIFLESIALLFP